MILLSGALGFAVLFGRQLPINPVAAASSASNFNYIVTIVMENEHAGSIFGNSCCPYETSLANQYSLATSYSDIYSPSLPNYIALTSGSTQGITDDNGPSSHPLGVTNIVDRLEAASLSWKAYMESMPSNCYSSDSSAQGTYYVRHDPFVYYTDISGNSARCSKVVPSGGACPNGASGNQILTCDSSLLNDLNVTSGWPNYMWLTPNGCNDMHDCSTSTGDTYLSSLIPKILSSTLFTNPANKAALFLLWDEYSPTPGAVWAGPVAKTAYKSSTSYNHYSAIKTIESNWGLATMSTGDGAATSMAEFFTSSSATPDFGLIASPASASFTVGNTGSSTITMTMINGFAGTVTLSQSSPSGITTVCLPGTLSLTVLASACAFTAGAAASGTVTITGTSGTLTHSASVSVTATSSGGTGNFVASQWSLTANSPSTAVIFGGSLQETVIDTASSYTGSFYSTAQYLNENGFGGPPLPVSSFSAHVNIGAINTVPGGYLYHTYMGLYFTLPSAVTAGGLTSSWIDGQVQVEQCSSSISGGCDPAGYTYNSNLGNRFGYREILTTQGANSSYDFVNFNVQAFCARAEAAWGIPSTPCTFVRIEPGMEGYGVNPFSIVWTTFSVTAPSQCTNGATNPPACTLCPTGQIIVNGLCATQDFGISAFPSSVSTVQGTAAASTIALTSINSLAGTVTLSGVSSASSISITISPSSLSLTAGGQGASTLTISTTSSTPVGSYTVTVRGLAGTLSHSVIVSFSVTAPTPAPDFAISASQATLSVVQGSSTTSTIALTSLSGFAGTISLAQAISTSNATASLGSSSITLSAGGTGTATLTISTIASTPDATYSASVTGTSGSLSHLVTISVTVVSPPDFVLASSPFSISIPGGSSGFVTLTVTSLNGFTGSLSLTVAPSSTGFAFLFSPTSLTLGAGAQASSSLTISPSNNVSAGSYTASITGTGAGLSHSIAISIVVTVPVTQPLQGSMSWRPSTATIGQTVTFTASAINGLQPYSFHWKFGDGSTSSGATVNHTYSSSGNYTVSLVVVDASSLTAASHNTLTVVTGSTIAVLLAVPSSEMVSTGSILSFVVNASNPQAPGPISISASNMPPGAVFISTPGNPAIGKFSWDPTSSAQAGWYNVTFSAVQSGSSYSSSKTVLVEFAGVPSTSCSFCGFNWLWQIITLVMIGAAVGLLATFVSVSFRKSHKIRLKEFLSVPPIVSNMTSRIAVTPLLGNPHTSNAIRRPKGASTRGTHRRKVKDLRSDVISGLVKHGARTVKEKR